MRPTRDKKIKTDNRDARAQCEACRLGAYRLAHRTSERQRKIRAQLLVGSTLVRTRSKYISLVGALARREGCRIATGGSNNFAAQVEAAGLPAHVTADEREQSGETSLAGLEEACVRAGNERKYLTRGCRFTEPVSDTKGRP